MSEAPAPFRWIVCNQRDGGKLFYEFGRRLGTGSFGSVYAIKRAVDSATKQPISTAPLCVKVEPITHGKDGQRGTSFLRMEFRVYQELAKTVDAHYFPKVVDFGIYEGARFLIMERGGMSLEECGSKLTRRQKLTCLWETIRALRGMHEAGLLHRDIKPANILASRVPGGRVQLVDMGFTKRFRVGPYGTHIPDKQKRTLTGTLDFASVSTLSGRENDRRCDLEAMVYTFAVVMGSSHLPWTQFILDRREEEGVQPSRTTLHGLLQRKRETSAAHIAGPHAPPCLAAILRIVRKLKFAEDPPYREMLALVEADLKSGV